MLKLFLGSLYLSLFLFVMNKIENEYLSKKEFKLDKIEFNGEYSLLKDELTKISNMIYGKNMWEVSLEKLEEKLKTDVRIKDIDISYKGLGKVEFNIKEKVPSYYVNIGEKVYAIDEKGEIFSFIDEAPIKELPIIFINNEKEIEEILKIFQKVENREFKKMILQVHYKNSSEIDLIINKGTIMKTKIDVIDEKYNIARELYFNLSKEHKIEYIDLRFDDYIVKEMGADSIDGTKRDNKNSN